MTSIRPTAETCPASAINLSPLTTEKAASVTQAVMPNRLPNTHRVHSSCDRCRSRKTKCIDPVPGPCRYCARTGATCRIATPRRKRPYYHVTEEEYQCSMRILEHFFPDQELNLQSLRTIAKHVTEGKLRSPIQSIEKSPSAPDVSPVEDESAQEVDPVVESVKDLHAPLGCLMKDSRGRFRYIGAHSEIPFNAAVCAIGDESQTSSTIIMPPKVGSFPPSMPTPSPSVEGTSWSDRYYLPSRRACDFYISRFLEEVHCSHWFYSIEAFLARIENTYSASAEFESSSWLCSLYSIFAIGASSSQCQEDKLADDKISTDYISLAKQLIPTVYDEADIDSIRALAILSIALENLCSRVSSYLYIGASIQIAYSLGLHRDQTPETGASSEREQHRRIWWTLFMLDQEIASRGGTPNVIDERSLKIDTPLPSEQVLYPGMHTPLGWLSTSVSLCRLKREIMQTVYGERSPSPKNLSFTTISNLLLSLQKWLQLIPPHLKHDVPTPPTHKRAVAVLHLNYWSSTILLCRPFLLYLVLKYNSLSSSKKIWFERMGKTCIDAAQKSVAILELMASDGALSSLTAFDSTCFLRAIMIFILAYAHTKLQHYRSSIETSLTLLRGMEQTGWCKIVTEETPLRLADVGISDDSKAGRGGVLLDDDLIAQLWGNFDPGNNLMTPMQTQQNLDMAFDDASSFDLNSEILQFTNLDDSIVINPSQVYTSFDLG